jgi:xanthine dehydrogenase accessory factor
MAEWLNALANPAATMTSAVLVTVAGAEGSVPREPGAKMVVTTDGQFDTIGGGHLEFCACEYARKMLALPASDIAGQRRLERFALGPTLGQCCGGVVWLAFERVGPDTAALFGALRQRWQQGQDSWRVTALDRLAAPAVYDADGICIAGAPVNLDCPFDRARPCHVMQDPAGARWLIDSSLPYPARLYLFGAGHVGAAIVRTLADLPCHVTWIDEREDMFPMALPANVTVEATDTPEALIAAAPAGASFLVMTHSHALDQRLAEHILRRADIGWFGLIGSHTKRIQFERRLRERGIPDQRLADMVCPIGIPGIDGKAPAVIAVAVAGQLLQVWERQQSTQQPTQHPIQQPSLRGQENCG